MERDVALEELADEWRRQGKVGGTPTLWDLAVALAKAGVVGEQADAPAAGADADLPQAE